MLNDLGHGLECVTTRVCQLDDKGRNALLVDEKVQWSFCVLKEVSLKEVLQVCL